MDIDDSRYIEDGNDDAYRIYRQASDEMLAGRIESALELFERSNLLSPHYKTCLHIGECLVNLNRHREAIVPLAAATASNRQGIAPTLLAEVFLAIEEPDKAHEFVRLALERQPHYKRAQELEPIAQKKRMNAGRVSFSANRNYGETLNGHFEIFD